MPWISSEIWFEAWLWLTPIDRLSRNRFHRKSIKFPEITKNTRDQLKIQSSVGTILFVKLASAVNKIAVIRARRQSLRGKFKGRGGLESSSAGAIYSSCEGRFRCRNELIDELGELLSGLTRSFVILVSMTDESRRRASSAAPGAKMARAFRRQFAQD